MPAGSKGMPSEDIRQMMAENAKKEAGRAIAEGADVEDFGLPGFPTHWGTAVVPEAGLVILTIGTKNGPLSFSLRPAALEGDEGQDGIISGLQQALVQARSGLVVPNAGQPG